MNIQHCLSFTAISIFTAALASVAKAQNLPPASIGNLNIALNIKGGNGQVLANSGTATATFTPAGSFAFLDTSGNVGPGQYGVYSYAIVNSNTGRIVYRQPTATSPDETMTLTFTDSLNGSYTAVAGSGTANGTFTLGANDTSAPLINISNRLQVTPNQIAIAGFVVGGPIPRRVLIRAIGPSLLQFGVSDAIRATTMTVYSGNQILATNTGWSTDATKIQSLTNAFASTGAFPLTGGSRDSAVLLTLAPGNYSSVVGGQLSSDSGSVLIEVYYAP